jgi:hypothetical protein
MMNLTTIFSWAWSGHGVILILQNFLGAGGARCLSVFDVMVGGGSSSPWIVTGGKGGSMTSDTLPPGEARSISLPQDWMENHNLLQPQAAYFGPFQRLIQVSVASLSLYPLGGFIAR